MIQDLTIEKNCTQVSALLGVTKILSNKACGRESLTQSIRELFHIDANEKSRNAYNKSKISRYFGFVDGNFNDHNTPTLDEFYITPRGEFIKKFIVDGPTINSSGSEILKKIILYSVMFDSFGKYNCGAESSNSDLDPPKIILKFLRKFGPATKEQISYALWGLWANSSCKNSPRFESLDDAIKKIEKDKNDGIIHNAVEKERLPESHFHQKDNFVRDFKLLDFFTEKEVSLVKKNRDLYQLNDCIDTFSLELIDQLNISPAPNQIIVKSTKMDLEGIQKWVRVIIAGSCGDNSNYITCDLKDGVDKCIESFNEAIKKAYAYITENNNSLKVKKVYYVVKDKDGEESALISFLKKTFHPDFSRNEDFRNKNFGWSIKEINKQKLPPNLNIIGISSMKIEDEIKGFSTLNIDQDESYSKKNLDSQDYQVIYFGAPGTGKSNSLKKESEKIFPAGNIERVTFHPAYTFSNFFGSFKPSGKGSNIEYKFKPGPFMNIYEKAWKAKYDERGNLRTEKCEKFLLIIEEINRANVAAVFGEIFQLLDRKNGESEYPVAMSNEVQEHLTQKIRYLKDLKIPDNMYIWATMNSADQGVQPLDTAFKRRWNFKYIGLNTGVNELLSKEPEIKLEDIFIPLGSQESENESEEINLSYMKWNSFRTSTNNALKKLKINEDKCLGAFFLDTNQLLNVHKILQQLGASANAKSIIIDSKTNPKYQEIRTFREFFCNKVLMYLFEDAAKMHRNSLFSEKICKEQDCQNVYLSDIIKYFETNGTAIFNDQNWKETK